MKRHPVILPLVLPRLTDHTAARLVELLHELIAGIEHRYAEPVHRDRRRARDIPPDRQSPPASLDDPPF